MKTSKEVKAFKGRCLRATCANRFVRALFSATISDPRALQLRVRPVERANAGLFGTIGYGGRTEKVFVFVLEF